jgi:hypothetical protein
VSEQTPEPMSGADRDLAIIAERSRGDAYLHDLVTTAEEGIPAAVGLLLNGMVIYGALAAPQRIAEEVDTHYDWMTRGLQERSDEQAEGWAKAREKLSGVRARYAEEDEKEREEHYDRLTEAYGDPGDFDPLTGPADVARDALRHALRATLTLENATIATGQGRIEVPVLRVQIPQIAAWWLMREGDASVTLNLRSAMPPER